MIRLSAVWAMLEVCAPGYTKRATKHHWRIAFAGRTYPTFPLGPHGSRKAKSTEVEVGHVRKLCRYLEIVACAEVEIEQL